MQKSREHVASFPQYPGFLPGFDGKMGPLQNPRFATAPSFSPFQE